MAYGAIPRGFVVMHECDNRACCRIDHLRLGTQLENIADRNAKGRQARGSKIGCSKLSERDVLGMRREFAFGAAAKHVAAKYGITERHAMFIRSGRGWAHVQ